jgi:hypothetical protein
MVVKLPYSDKSKKREYDRERLRRIRLAQQERDERVYGLTTEDLTKNTKQFPEHEAYAQAFKTEKPIISDSVLNPKPLPNPNSIHYREGNNITSMNDSDIASALGHKEELRKKSEMEKAVDEQKALD